MRTAQRILFTLLAMLAFIPAGKSFAQTIGGGLSTSLNIGGYGTVNVGAGTSGVSAGVNVAGSSIGAGSTSQPGQVQQASNGQPQGIVYQNMQHGEAAQRLFAR